MCLLICKSGIGDIEATRSTALSYQYSFFFFNFSALINSDCIDRQERQWRERGSHAAKGTGHIQTHAHNVMWYALYTVSRHSAQLSVYILIHCTDFFSNSHHSSPRSFSLPAQYVVSLYHFSQARGLASWLPASTNQRLLEKLRVPDQEKGSSEQCIKATKLVFGQVQVAAGPNWAEFLLLAIALGVDFVFDDLGALCLDCCHWITLKWRKMSFGGSVPLSSPTKYRCQQCWRCPALAW